MEKVTVYTKKPCPYCEMAKALLLEKGIPFKEILIDTSDAEEVLALKKKTGWQTFPQIFEGDKLIGGYRELAARLK